MIHLLNAEAYAGELPRPSRNGVNALFRAKILIDSEPRHCFVKPLPDIIPAPGGRAANQELVSEAIGYCLAKACGFEVPSVAGVINLPRQTIPGYALQAADANTAGPPQDSFLAWFSEDMRYPDLIWYFAGGELDPKLEEQVWKRISAALADHAEVPRLVTFDEWLQNSDRHPGNLLYAGQHRVSLIDHGRIFHYPSWAADRLHAAPAFAENRVAGCVEATVPRWREQLPIRNARAQAYDEIGEQFRDNGEASTRAMLAQLMLDPTHIDHIVDFLTSRLGPGHVQLATGMGNML